MSELCSRHPCEGSQPSQGWREAELTALQREMRACRRCTEAGFAVQGPAIFSGPATARVMLIGQAPAEIDLRSGSRPWSGTGGRRLMGWLEQAGFDAERFRAEQYLAALTRCFPGKAPGGRGDRAPGRIERALCAPYLRHEIELIRPQLIIAVGGLAIAHFLGDGALAERVGEAYENLPQVRNLREAWVLPLPHPSGASLWLNAPANQARVAQALRRLAELRVSLGL